MNNLVVVSNRFEASKEHIKNFSNETNREFDFSIQNENKKAGEWFIGALFAGDLRLKHQITGEEFNALIGEIQKHLIAINNTQNSIINEFSWVYNALDSVDKEVISEHWKMLCSTYQLAETIKSQQETIESTIDALKKFKIKMESFAHLEDIDKIWEMIEIQSEQIEFLQKQNEEIITFMNDKKEFLMQNQKNENNITFSKINSKIKYLYFIAGGSLGLALVELLIIFLQVF